MAFSMMTPEDCLGLVPRALCNSIFHRKQEAVEYAQSGRLLSS